MTMTATSTSRSRGLHVRVYAAGTTRLMGARSVESGSGYDAQRPPHSGVAARRGAR